MKDEFGCTALHVIFWPFFLDRRHPQFTTGLLLQDTRSSRRRVCKYNTTQIFQFPGKFPLFLANLLIPETRISVYVFVKIKI